MLSYAKNYFRNCRLARMSNGEVCLIRDQGLVKGGRGLKHHEELIAFSIRGLAAKFRQSPKTNGIRERDFFPGRRFARLGRALGGISFFKKPAALRRACAPPRACAGNRNKRPEPAFVRSEPSAFSTMRKIGEKQIERT
jgi:hypothetical protein